MHAMNNLPRRDPLTSTNSIDILDIALEMHGQKRFDVYLS